MNRNSSKDLPTTQEEDLLAAKVKITELQYAMMDAILILGGLSMATTGAIRANVCSASNKLNHALGRTQSSHGEQF